MEETLPVQKKKGHPVLLAILFILIGAGLLAASTYLGYTNGLMTDGQCNETATNASIFGVNYGMEYAIAAITQKAIQCDEIPINYSNYSYTLIAIECLNLNQEQ